MLIMAMQKKSLQIPLTTKKAESILIKTFHLKITDDTSWE